MDWLAQKACLKFLFVVCDCPVFSAATEIAQSTPGSESAVKISKIKSVRIHSSPLCIYVVVRDNIWHRYGFGLRCLQLTEALQEGMILNE